MSDATLQDEFESMTAPGKLLRDQREKMGLTQAEVAARMRLSQQSIKDIEADDYSHFSAPIYVRGYIRNYAAMMALKSQPLLQAFDQMGFVDQLNQMPRTSYISSSVSNTTRLTRSKHHFVRLMTYFFFGLLLALVVVWWYGQRHHRHADIASRVMSELSTETTARKHRVLSHKTIPIRVKQETHV